MTDPMQQARERFEAWATSQHLPIKRHRWGEYKVEDTEAAWEAWQAALRAAPEVTPEMVAAAEEAYMPFGDMEFALNCALASRPQGRAMRDMTHQQRTGAKRSRLE